MNSGNQGSGIMSPLLSHYRNNTNVTSLMTPNNTNQSLNTFLSQANLVNQV